MRGGLWRKGRDLRHSHASCPDRLSAYAVCCGERANVRLTGGWCGRMLSGQEEVEMDWRDYLTEDEAFTMLEIERHRDRMFQLNNTYRTISERARKRGARAVERGEK